MIDNSIRVKNGIIVGSSSVKKCGHCSKEKDLSQYYVKKDNSDGVYSICIACYKKKANKRNTDRISKVKTDWVGIDGQDFFNYNGDALFC